MFHTTVSFISCRWCREQVAQVGRVHVGSQREEHLARAGEVGERVLGAAAERLEHRARRVDRRDDARVDRHRAVRRGRPGHDRLAEIGVERRREHRAGLGRGDRHPGVGPGEGRQQQGGVLDRSAPSAPRPTGPATRSRSATTAPARARAGTRPRCRSSRGCAATRRGRCRRRSAPCRRRARRRPRPRSPRTSSRGRRGSVVAPNTGLNVWEPAPNSGVFVLPSSTAPASRARTTSRSSASGTVSAKIGEPHVVRMPAVADEVLVRDRQTVQRARLVAAGERLVGPARGLDRAIGSERHDRVDGRVHGLDAVEVGGEHLASRELTAAHAPSQLGRGQEAEFARGCHRPQATPTHANGPGASPGPMRESVVVRGS